MQSEPKTKLYSSREDSSLIKHIQLVTFATNRAFKQNASKRMAISMPLFQDWHSRQDTSRSTGDISPPTQLSQPYRMNQRLHMMLLTQILSRLWIQHLQALSNFLWFFFCYFLAFSFFCLNMTLNTTITDNEILSVSVINYKKKWLDITSTQYVKITNFWVLVN